jgi:predicted GH43/DUF377 family glycosyl hydrolase
LPEVAADKQAFAARLKLRCMKMRKPAPFARYLLGVVALAISVTAAAQTVFSDAPLRQNWVKRGVILQPGFAGAASSHFVSSPSVVRLEDGRLRMYVWVANGTPPWLNGHHIVIAVENEAANPHSWRVVSKGAMVGPDPSSPIRDRGVGFPYVLPRDDGPWLMYHGTWGGDWTKKRELLNRLGLAVSHDKGLTWKVEKENLLPSGAPGSFDAGAIPSATVLRVSRDDYLMWYTTAEKYLRFGETNQGIMHLGLARSRDGVAWSKLDQPAMRAREGAAEPYEACLARPAVLKLDGVYHMWFGVYDMAPGSRAGASGGATGSGSYRLEYARSSDGLTWTRFPDQPVLPLTPGAFDSTSQTYASVVEMGEEIWLFYTGDGLGTTGVGLATLKKSELRSGSGSVNSRIRSR